VSAALPFSRISAFSFRGNCVMISLECYRDQEESPQKSFFGREVTRTCQLSLPQKGTLCNVPLLTAPTS